MSDESVEEANLLRALQVIGLGFSEAKVLATIVNMRIEKPSEIIKNTGLSRGTVYSSLERLVAEGYVEKRETQPVSYSVISGTLEKVATELEKVRKSLVKVSAKKTKESPRALEEIFLAFERTGFAIRELPPGQIRRQRPFLRIKRVAEAEYSIGILLYDRNTYRTVGREHMPFLYGIQENQASVGAITTFIFVHPDFRESKAVYKDLTHMIIRQSERYFMPSRSTGIIDRPFFVFRTTDNIPEVITGAISEIRRRRIAANDFINRLKGQLSQAEQLIDACREHAKEIEDMTLGKYRPFTGHDQIGKEIKKIADPVERIKNREIRNLQYFRKRFNRISDKVSNYVDAFEARTFLPSSSLLEFRSKELETVISKLTPIEFELNDLRENLFSYATSLLLSKKAGRTQFNPFMFTEPYEADNFFVDQEEINKRAPELAEAIVEGRADNFNVVTGAAGCGKTHALRYIYQPIMEAHKVKTFYVDCPVSYDLVECVFKELTQEIYYVSESLETIRVLRKSTPSMPRELMNIMARIRDVMRSAGFEGILIEIDELENMLPYPEDLSQDEGRRSPLALRQLQEMLSRSIDNVGYIISCRDKAYARIAQSLGIVNIEKFTVIPSKLGETDLKNIILRRYQVWHVPGPMFAGDVIHEIVKKTDGNARNAIRYCREVFKLALRNNLKIIDSKTLSAVKEIPIFTY